MPTEKIQFPFIGGAYQARSLRFQNQRSVNLYPELNEAALPAKEGEIAVLMSVPGKKLALDLNQPGAGIRGLHVPSNNPNVLFVACGASVYRILGAAFSVVPLTGLLATTTGPVAMADNGSSLILVDGQLGYTASLGGGALTQITSPNFHAASAVTFMDGWFILNRVGTAQFFFSNVYATTFPALNEATKTGSSDNLITVAANNRQLYLFGDRTIEIWFTAGGAITPFERAQGKFIQIGCLAAGSVARLNATLFWLGNSDDGGGLVYQLQNDQPLRISTHAVEASLQAAKEHLTQATAYTYQQDGHFFYCLNVPTLNTTWCYDLASKQWHERQQFTAGVPNQDRVSSHAYFNGQHVVGDRLHSRLYTFDFETFTDHDQPLVRLRQSPHVSHDLDRVFYSELELDFKFGVGTATGLGQLPVANLAISDDGGLTFGPELPQSLGRVGDFLARARWFRLGYSYSRVFRVTVSDPVDVQLLSARLRVLPGTS